MTSQQNHGTVRWKWGQNFPRSSMLKPQYTTNLRGNLQSKTQSQGSPVNQGSSQEKMNFGVFRDQPLQPGLALVRLANELVTSHIFEGSWRH